MRQATLILPEYSSQFRCIGPACEDSCCVGWTVNIDQAAYEKYQTIPAGPLRALIDANLMRARETAAGSPQSGSTPAGSAPPGSTPAAFAQVRLQPPLHACPFLSPERLCQIQVEHGESYLSDVCSTFPRIHHRIDNLQNTSLSLACPEAARLVLLNPDLLAHGSRNGRRMAWDEAAADACGPQAWFWPLREFSIELIRNRAYPLWQRMFLLGTFCRRLQAITHGELDRPISALLRDFSAAVESRSLRAFMDTIPADVGLQLNFLLALIGQNADNARSSSRFQASLDDFIEGAGAENEIAAGKQEAQYASAYRRCYAPFFERHPNILENYLINAMFKGMFPYGAKAFDPGATQEPEREYTMLAIEFALIKGLLIGVAGCYREAFCAEHAVKTIQVVSRHFEHDPKQLSQAYELLVSKNLNSAQGLAMLLRN